MRAETVRFARKDKAAIVVGVIDADRMSTRMAASMLEVDATLSSWPQLGSDVVLGGASVTAAVRMLALGWPLASGRRYVDLERWPRPSTGSRCSR